MRRLRPGWRFPRWFPYAAIAVGGILVATGVSYLIYARVARTGLSELAYEVPPEQRPELGLGPPPAPTATAAAAPEASPGPSSVATEAPHPAIVRLAEPESRGIYPAAWVNPKYWSDPYWAGSDPYGGRGLPAGFERVDARNVTSAIGGGSAASAVRIEAIGLDAEVIELDIVDLEDSRAYETPKNVVGHIPGTANPGEPAGGWYFGHLESLARGEGSVFRNLTRIPGLIKEDPVDVVVANTDGEYLYRVTGAAVVHEDDLELADSSYSTITLVACVPAKVYDHRLLVSAELIAVRS